MAANEADDDDDDENIDRISTMWVSMMDTITTLNQNKEIEASVFFAFQKKCQSWIFNMYAYFLQDKQTNKQTNQQANVTVWLTNVGVMCVHIKLAY